MKIKTFMAKGDHKDRPYGRVGANLVFALLVFTVLFPCLTEAARAQSIKVTIDRAEATIQDQLNLRVTVEGAANAQPTLPDLSAFKVYRNGNQSQQTIVNGRRTISLTFNFVLVPKQVGNFTIGAATVELGGRTYKSRPFRIRILDASATPRESDALFVTAKVSNDNPYVGEQVIFTWQFYRRVRVVDAQIDALTFEGFLEENLGEVREFNTTLRGQDYLVSEIKKALFPQEQGSLAIAPTQLRCEVVSRTQSRRGSLLDSVFGRSQTQSKVLRSPAIEVNVRPLPAPPAGFSGLVGDFKIQAKLAKRELQVGESATWKLTVSGTGNVQMIAEPSMPEMPQFKSYDDKPTSSIERGGSRLSGSRSFTKALVPLESGELTVPPIRLTYFDTKEGTYKTPSTPPIRLTVSPADGKEELRLTESVGATTGKVSVRILADDILPIYKNLDAVGKVPFGHRANPVWLASFLAPPLLFLGLLFFERRRHHFAVNTDLVRRRTALKKALKSLGEVEKAAGEGRHSEAGQAASRVLREYVGDKVALEGSAFTPTEAEAQLRQYGVDDEIVRQTKERLESLEAVQYAGIEASESENLAAELRPLLKQLEQQIRR